MSEDNHQSAGEFTDNAPNELRSLWQQTETLNKKLHYRNKLMLASVIVFLIGAGLSMYRAYLLREEYKELAKQTEIVTKEYEVLLKTVIEWKAIVNSMDSLYLSLHHIESSGSGGSAEGYFYPFHHYYPEDSTTITLHLVPGSFSQQGETKWCLDGNCWSESELRKDPKLCDSLYRAFESRRIMDDFYETLKDI